MQEIASTIIYTEDSWANSPLSIARHYGSVNINGKTYIIVNKDGKDIYECSHEAEKEGREMAIPPGEPCDLIDASYQSIYKAVGRNEFIKMVKQGKSLHDMQQLVGK